MITDGDEIDTNDGLTHWDVIPVEPGGSLKPADIQIACGLDWTDGWDISMDLADVTCPGCIKHTMRGQVLIEKPAAHVDNRSSVEWVIQTCGEKPNPHSEDWEDDEVFAEEEGARPRIDELREKWPDDGFRLAVRRKSFEVLG